MDCPGDKVRRFPPAPPEAGAGAPLPAKGRSARSGAEGSAEPTQVKPGQANLTPKEKADKLPPPGEMGPESGPSS